MRSLCDKCRVKFSKKNRSYRLYLKSWVCQKCRKEWQEEFKRLKFEYPDRSGWRDWEPIFMQWLKDCVKEIVIFT